MRLIDAEALIKDLETVNPISRVYNAKIAWAKAMIDAAPTVLAEAVQGWISCSERLPESVKKTYWICTDTEYQCECRWTNVNPIWTDLTTDWHWNKFDIPQYSEVIAWMPLPKPYGERSEE